MSLKDKILVGVMGLSSFAGLKANSPDRNTPIIDPPENKYNITLDSLTTDPDPEVAEFPANAGDPTDPPAKTSYEVFQANKHNLALPKWMKAAKAGYDGWGANPGLGANVTFETDSPVISPSLGVQGGAIEIGNRWVVNPNRKQGKDEAGFRTNLQVNPNNPDGFFATTQVFTNKFSTPVIGYEHDKIEDDKIHMRLPLFAKSVENNGQYIIGANATYEVQGNRDFGLKPYVSYSTSLSQRTGKLNKPRNIFEAEVTEKAAPDGFLRGSVGALTHLGYSPYQVQAELGKNPNVKAIVAGSHNHVGAGATFILDDKGGYLDEESITGLVSLPFNKEGVSLNVQTKNILSRDIDVEYRVRPGDDILRTKIPIIQTNSGKDKSVRFEAGIKTTTPTQGDDAFKNITAGPYVGVKKSFGRGL